MKKKELSIPDLISKFVASDTTELKVSMYKDEIDTLKQYLYESDVQAIEIKPENKFKWKIFKPKKETIIIRKI